jgi:hypothetical protein
VIPNSGAPNPQNSSSIAGSVLPLQKAEELLATLTDVVSAKIIAGPSGAVEAIHVLVTGESPAKQMVRNIESALMAQLGMRVDHRKISIATTVKRSGEVPAIGGSGGSGGGGVTPSGEVPAYVPPTAAAELPTAAAVGRALYFEDVEIRGSRTKGVTCKVTLRRGKETFVGEAEGFESDKSRVELSARASLAAIALSEGAEGRLSLEGVKVVTAFDRELVLVGVMARIARQGTLLTGSCEIRDSAETAAALAVLNATNRWVEGVR